MTELPRDRVLATLDHQETNRAPFSFGFGPTGEARRALDAYLKPLGADFSTLDRAAADIRSVAPRYIGPPLPSETDIWGIRRKPVAYATGTYDEIVHYPLGGVRAAGKISRYPWPRVDDFDFGVLPEAIRLRGENGRYAIRASGGNPFEIFCWMTGLEEALVMLIESPDVVTRGLEHITNFFCEYCMRQLDAAAGGIDLVFTADDLGGQQGPLMSRTMYREIIMPHHRHLHNIIHGFGARTLYHSDGSVIDLVPDLIEAGVDILEAVQVDAAGMDPRALKALAGDRLSFHGGVSVQHLLPHGTPDDVRREVAELKRVFGAGGGYICAPTHAIQAGTPPENVIAMVEEATEQSLDDLLAAAG